MDKLKEYELKVRWSDNPDASPIDFSIEDDEDNVCWVWGNSVDDVEVECDHPVIEYDDDETVGECPVCGATCDWHWVVSADDGYEIKERVPHGWHRPEKVSGIVKEILDEMR